MRKWNKWIAFLLLMAALSMSAKSPNPSDFTAESVVLLDAKKGRVLWEKNGTIPYPPASLTKLITLYLALDSMTQEEGPEYSDTFIIDSCGSSFSRPEGSSLMLLEEGQIVTWLELLKGLAIASGNDAAYAIASILDKEPSRFVDRMNTFCDLEGFPFYFEDPDGWSHNNRVTPVGMALFAMKYIHDFPDALSLLHDELYLDFPRESNWQKGYSYRITQSRRKKNTNLLLGVVEGVDGLKTGYIEESGFHFIATAQRGQTRLIAVVMGIREKDYFRGLELRAKEAAQLLEFGFENFRTMPWAIPDTIAIPVRKSGGRVLSPLIEGVSELTLTEEERRTAICVMELSETCTAPLHKGEPVGSLLLWNEWLPAEWLILSGEETGRKSFF